MCRDAVLLLQWLFFIGSRCGALALLDFLFFFDWLAVLLLSGFFFFWGLILGSPVAASSPEPKALIFFWFNNSRFHRPLLLFLSPLLLSYSRSFPSFSSLFLFSLPKLPPPHSSSSCYHGRRRRSLRCLWPALSLSGRSSSTTYSRSSKESFFPAERPLASMLRQGKSRSERTLRNSWPTAPVTPTTATETVRSRDRALLRRARTRRAEALRLQVQVQHHHRCPIEGTLRVGSIKAMKKRKKKRFLSTNCQICFAQSRLKLPHCLPSTDSRIYLDSCFLRYADHNVSADATDAYDTAVCGNASTNSSAFKDAATRLVANLTAAALNQTEFYQVGSANVAADGLVYGTAQCWKSLNASE